MRFKIDLTMAQFLPPANKVCEGYIFMRICHSVHRGGGGAWSQGGCGDPPRDGYCCVGTHPTGMHSC